MEETPTIHHKETLDSKQWAQAIRLLRNDKGWSQKDLADRLDVHPQSISEIERGKERLTLERLHRILDALGYASQVFIWERKPSTRADWGPIYATEPERRRLVRQSRKLAEQLADKLYRQFHVENVLCFGSLVEDGGRNFTGHSDIELIVEGLDLYELFHARSSLELEIMEQERGKTDISFDLMEAEDLNRTINEMIRERDAVPMPMILQSSYEE